MKKVKFLSVVLAIFTIILLFGCGSDLREYYIEQLEELDRGDLVALNRWLDDNEESMDDLFEFAHIRVDFEGNELDFASQVLGLEIDYFDRWSFAVVDDVITFTYRWDYESATAALEEEIIEDIADSLASDNEWLASWISEDVIVQFEEIDVEDPLMFIATTGGFITGVRSTLDDLTASDYLIMQIDHVVSFIEEVQIVVIQNIDNETLELAEIRDLIIGTLNEMSDLLLELHE